MLNHDSTIRPRDGLHAIGFFILCLGLTLLIAITGCQSSGTKLLAGIRDSGDRRSLERGDSLAAEQRYEEAAQVYGEILRKDPNHGPANARMARLQFLNGDYEHAASYYRAALKSDPSCFHYALCLAQCQSRLATTSIDREQKMEAAARAYRYAQSLDPQNFTATIQLAMCYRELGDFEKALGILKEAAAQHPGAPIIHTQIGEIYHSQNDFEHAMEEFKLALKIDGGNLAAHNGCGIVNTTLAQGNGAKGAMARERAVAHFRRSLQLNPNQPQIRGMLEQFEPYQWKAVTVAEEQP